MTIDLNLYTAPWAVPTIYNLDFISEDQLVFHMLKHLKSLPHRAVEDNQVYCTYLSPSGLKCVAGSLIPESFWLNKPEEDKGGPNWGQLAIEYNLSEHHSYLIGAFQRIHDTRVNWNPEGFIFDKTTILKTLRNQECNLSPLSLEIIDFFCSGGV